VHSFKLYLLTLKNEAEMKKKWKKHWNTYLNKRQFNVNSQTHFYYNYYKWEQSLCLISASEYKMAHLHQKASCYFFHFGFVWKKGVRGIGKLLTTQIHLVINFNPSNNSIKRRVIIIIHFFFIKSHLFFNNWRVERLKRFRENKS